MAARPSALAYARSLARVPADLASLDARVGEAIVYPVKAFGGLSLPRVGVGRHGLFDPATGFADRSAMIAIVAPGITPEGQAYDALAWSNRIDGTPTLARARLDRDTLVYEAPGVEPLRLRADALAPRAGPIVRVKLYEGGPVIEGVREDGPLTAWAQALLRAHPRTRKFRAEDVIALVPSLEGQRSVAAKHAAGEDAATFFGDGAHLLVASSSTLAWMNDALRANGEREVAMEAFRPNLVIDGLPPNAEDIIATAHVEASGSGVPLVFATMCVRCDATRVDPATGMRAGKQPLAFLARERPPRLSDPTSATFAINAVVPAQAHGRAFAVGDRVRIVQERDA